MKRLAICVALAALAIMAIAAAGASAAPKPLVKRTCVTTSKNVRTKSVTGTVVGTKVAATEIQYTRCPLVKSVMNKMLSGRIEKPQLWEGFRCAPNVVETGPDVVAYRCVYRGFSTATFVKLTFAARYKG